MSINNLSPQVEKISIENTTEPVKTYDDIVLEIGRCPPDDGVD